MIAPGRISSLGLLVLVSCSTPGIQEGLPCADDSCPAGQTCGPDGVCRIVHPDAGGCTADSCGDGFECIGGACVEIEDGTIDGRSSVGRVYVDGLSPSVRILGTLVSPRVVITCGTCLDDAAAPALSFSTGGPGLAVDVESVSYHPSLDAAALRLKVLFTKPRVVLGQEPPSVGSDYLAIVPDMAANDNVRLQQQIRVDQVEDEAFSYSSKRCPSSGGPTFDPGADDDIFVGLHVTTDCSTGAVDQRSDVRIDALGDWIADEIESAEPETCEEATGSCPGSCGNFVCDDSTGEVQTSCEPDDGNCSGDDFCDPDDFECRSCVDGDVRACGQCGEQSCSGGSWGTCQGTNSTLSCGECGRNYCQTNGNYGGCVAVQNLCASGTCVGGGTNFTCQVCTPNVGYISCGSCGRRYCNASGTGYSSTCTQVASLCDSSSQLCQWTGSNYNCATQYCTTSPYDDYCELTGDTPPSSISAGSSWLTGSGCLSGGCRNCTCNVDGTKNCGAGCFF